MPQKVSLKGLTPCEAEKIEKFLSKKHEQNPEFLGIVERLGKRVARFAVDGPVLSDEKK